MRSVKWPASPAHDPATLEARMDDLHRKLDRLLSRSPGGGCPMCGICSHHSKQQEATAGQLSAQAKLLDSLERNVTEVRTALEELARGLEDKSSDTMSVPAAALQRRKSLPVRTSVDEVYVRLDLPREKIIQHGFNVSCGKGQTGVLIEDSEGEGLRRNMQLVRGDKVEVKCRENPQPHKEVRALSAVAQHLAKMDAVTPSLTQKSSKATGLAPLTAVTSKMSTFASQITPKPATATSPNQTTPKTPETVSPVKMTPPLLNTIDPKNPESITLKLSQKTLQTAAPASPVSTTVNITPAVISSVPSNPPKFSITEITAPPPLPHSCPKTSQTTKSPSIGKTLCSQMSKSSNGTISKPPAAGGETQTPNHLAKTAGLTASTTTMTSNSATRETNNPQAWSGTHIVTPINNPPKIAPMGAPKATSQNLDKSSANSQTAKGSTGSPSKTAGLMVPIPAAAVSTLKHVYSCPESLQRLQGTEGKANSTDPAKTGTTAVRPTSTVAAGIEIKISPSAVPAEQSTAPTKTPPKTCFKIIDDVPPQPAPFPHRCVSLRPSLPCDFSIHTREVLGGGRFGKVHKCTDNKTGLRLAAKIISARSAKEREMAMNEIQVMNQLSHSNVLQLYDAFEAKNQVVLILEYVEGGELFERIVDESCPLTEVDAMVFVKQICEGVQYMHQMYVLHLDLKPENILCVNRSSHQIKIIDFGLARRYKPREKLRVSFGTPEFLAPEVVNFDFVSFPTDMWTLGVVTYMLLSGLSPFLGDDDSQTLNNVLTVNWYFDEDTFEHVSAEAKDFVSNLLIRERGGRLSATQCLKHPWLNNLSEKAKRSNIVLKSQVLLRKYMARRLWKLEQNPGEDFYTLDLNLPAPPYTKNYIAVAAANMFKKISSSGSLMSMGV